MASNEQPGGLGRIPSPPDPRDFRLIDHLDPDPLVAALKVLQASTKVAKDTKTWAAVMTLEFRAVNPYTPDPPPPPPPPDPLKDVIWPDPEEVLNQGSKGTCIGNGYAQWGNTLPIDSKLTEADAEDIYYDATIFDGQPDDPRAPGGGQQGATMRSGAKATQKRGMLTTYAFASSIAEVRAWLREKGPVVFGTNWTTDMFDVDQNGFVKPTGDVAGGHCYVAYADLVSIDAIGFLNSWGKSWGMSGRFRMKVADVEALFAEQGEAVVAVQTAP